MIRVSKLGMRVRNHHAEYLRRLANGAAAGLSKSQARGHARAGEAPIRTTKRKVDDRLEAALKHLRQHGDRAMAAKSVNVSPERFRRFLRENVEINGRGRTQTITYSRPRDWTVITDGEVRNVRLRDYDEASLNARHRAAVLEFIRSNTREVLEPFEGRAVIDVKGKAYPLETDPNELHRIMAQDDPVFHEIYRLVLKGE